LVYIVIACKQTDTFCRTNEIVCIDNGGNYIVWMSPASAVHCFIYKVRVFLFWEYGTTFRSLILLV